MANSTTHRIPPLVSQEAARSPARLVDEMARLFLLSRAIHAVAELGLADAIGETPREVREVAAETGTHAPALLRTLRFLSAYGIFEEAEPGTFRATGLSRVLRDDHPETLRPSLRRFDAAWWNAAGALEHTLRTGACAFTHATGMRLFDYLGRDPERQRRFDEGMAKVSDADDDAVAAACDFARFRTVVDVGGGRGGLLARILGRWPHLSGVLFDQPQVVAHPTRLLEAGLLDRCRCVAGNFFETVPPGADAYVIKGVLHDFDDRQCVAILRRCVEAVDGDGRVLVVERLLPSPAHGPDPSLTLDMLMMVLLEGRQRDVADWRRIFAAAGLELGRVIPTPTGFTVLEGVPRAGPV